MRICWRAAVAIEDDANWLVTVRVDFLHSQMGIICQDSAHSDEDCITSGTQFVYPAHVFLATVASRTLRPGQFTVQASCAVQEHLWPHTRTKPRRVK